MLASRGRNAGLARQISELVIGSRSFHSTPYSAESYRKRAARERKNKNIELRAQRALQAERDSPDPVLGHPLRDDSKWRACKLAQTVVARDELADKSSPSQNPALAATPDASRLGLSEQDHTFLFEQLPEVSAQATFLRPGGRDPLEWANSQPPELIKAEFVEQHKASMLARMIDLRNSNADDLAFENRKRIVSAFSPPGQGSDTGRPEVQAALLTLKIRNLWTHLRSAKKDVANVRHLRRLVHDRAKILKYLKRLDFQRWESCLEDLGMHPSAIEGDLIVNHPLTYS